MNENSKDKDNMMESGDILKMLDHVQNTLGECQRSCYKMNKFNNNSRKPGQDYASAALATQNNYWMPPNKIQKNSSLDQDRQTKNYNPSSGDVMEKTSTLKPYVESGGSNLKTSGGVGSYLSQDDIKTISGYSTEEDGTISINSRPRNSEQEQRQTSDSDNNSMVVEFSSDAESITQRQIKSKSYNTKLQDIIDKLHVIKNSAADVSLTVNNRRRSLQSHFIRSTSKRAKLSNSFRSFEEITTNPPISQTRRGSKTKLHQHQQQQQHKHQSNDSSSRSNSYHQDCHSNKCDSTSTFIQNHYSRASISQAPRLAFSHNQTTSESVGLGYHHHCHLASTSVNPAVNLNNQEFVYRHLPIYNNIPVLSGGKSSSVWPPTAVSPIYFQTNPHMYLVFDQQHPHQRPSPSSQMASNSSSMAMITSIAMENLIGKSCNPTSISNSTTNHHPTLGPMIRPELNWLHKELICPQTQTGPDGKPIKFKARRPPLPDWMEAAIENCDSAFGELKAARMDSEERLYRMIVEEEYEFQRLQENSN